MEMYGYMDIWVVAQMGWNMAGYVAEWKVRVTAMDAAPWQLSGALALHYCRLRVQ